MSVEFLGDAIWTRLHQAAEECEKPVHVAVAYFGQGAAQLLPLKRGSRLVVDASEGAVKSGQTCPDELKRLLRRGVRIYSVPNLHAKVYVIGNQAFAGSANVSKNAEQNLVEGCMVTNDRAVVVQARDFVRGLCLAPLTPSQLDELNTIYNPPKRPGGRRGSKRSSMKTGAEIPPLKLVQLILGDWPEREEILRERGACVAEKQREHHRGWQVDCFRWSGRVHFRVGDLVIQVVDKGSSRRQVHAPASVIHVQNFKSPFGRAAYVFLESPEDNECYPFKKLARHLGDNAEALLRRTGAVRNSDFARRLLMVWNR